ncbi:hypothetical protein DAEQUDRAFT_364745 [Daedalea quercina L-15889]|uniref:F-box domain-containing protein n=1 Tax=Daedalea quercina L-15889 TaxID=1314783 RepID=A0A165P8Q4_9APHY|nr:hypothetical protein DAEQUDRAFT_364745 [Daedalea quercina L-15889]
MTACAAPMEVLEGILNFVHDNPATLGACSLACHAWMPICRPLPEDHPRLQRGFVRQVSPHPALFRFHGCPRRRLRPRGQGLLPYPHDFGEA